MYLLHSYLILMLRGIPVFWLLLCSVCSTPVYFEWNNATFTFDNKTIELPADAPSLQSDFLTAPPKLPFKSYSQEHVQDILVLNVFGDKMNGYFVDLAANDWQSLSNSFVVEYFNNWKGVCIEPNPQYLKGLIANRKCSTYVNPVSSSTGELVKFTFGNGVYGGIVGADFDNKLSGAINADLITVTLVQILEHAKAPTVIDYLSLDVEGAEYHVLNKFDFNRYKFMSMSIERPTFRVHHLLVENGYRFVGQLTTFGECFYIHETLPNFDGVMSVSVPNDLNGRWNDQSHDYLLHKPKKHAGSHHAATLSTDEVGPSN